MAKLLFVVANVWFQDDEFWIPYQILSDQGYDIDVASGLGWRCRGVFMKSIDETKAFSQVNAEEYDMLVFVGWGGAYEEYFQNASYLDLARQAKAIAAICIAPTLVSDSGLLQGKHVTGWDDGFWTQIGYLQHNGAIFKDEEVVQDGDLITANGPAAATKFAWAIVDFLKNSWTGIYSSSEYHEW